MDDVEFFSLSKGFALTPGLELLSPHLQGFAAESAWQERMKVLVDDQIEFPEQGDEYDALRVQTQRRADFKWFTGVRVTQYDTTASVYLSHNEYLAGKEHNTVFVVFRNRGGAGCFTKAFTFDEAREANAIQLFEKGKWTQCARLGGKLMPPWSIELFLLDPQLRSILK